MVLLRRQSDAFPRWGVVHNPTIFSVMELSTIDTNHPWCATSRVERYPTRLENVKLHDIHLLDPTAGEFTEGVFAFRRAPKLVILSFAAEPRMLKSTDATDNYISEILSYTHGKMHPEGTIAIVVPHPWGIHFHRMQCESESTTGCFLALLGRRLGMDAATEHSCFVSAITWFFFIVLCSPRRFPQSITLSHETTCPTACSDPRQLRPFLSLRSYSSCGMLDALAIFFRCLRSGIHR